MASLAFETVFSMIESSAMPVVDRIRQIRQDRRWSKVELGERVGVHQKQVFAYERGGNLPPTEVLIKMAAVFDVTLDDLAFEAKGQPASINIQDREFLRRFEALDHLTEPEEHLAKKILDLANLKNRFPLLAQNGAEAA